jgi:dipeptidyl aminopeptidase/acylaminoacyl peptidase
MRRLLLVLTVGVAAVSASGAEQSDRQIDPALAFGSRPSVSDVSLSPDGASVAFVAPSANRGAVVYAVSTIGDSKPRVVLTSDGRPFRLLGCQWVSNSRLVCTVYWVQDVYARLVPFTRLVAVDADGRNLKVLSTQQREYQNGIALGGGQIIDLLPDEDGIVLMSRVYVPDNSTGSLIGTTERGYGVDRIDTRTLQKTVVEKPGRVRRYISDGHGNVRVMEMSELRAGYWTGVIKCFYRTTGSSDWRPLSEYDEIKRTGFRPVAVDPQMNVALGYQKKDGRFALYKIALDGSMQQDLVYENPDVDVGGLLEIGRKHRVVGIAYATDRSHAFYFDAAIKAVHDSLERALPKTPIISITDASVDESKLLVLAGSDNDPGTYYLFDRTTKQLRPLLQVREALAGVKLATVRPIQYPASDGTMIPAYLTLPPGMESAHGLPAIVMPHGGPSARDYFGFAWLPQYFASRGYAVLQPNYRGSTGYGDAWFENNGFRSWPIAIGDVLDAGRWLVAQGISDPGKVAIVGWSYGGYAALQSAVVDASVFKSIVAIAPVTDLKELKAEHVSAGDFTIMDQVVGEGPHLQDGSPLQNAARIKAPVLLFHGTLDINVWYEESVHMAAALAAVHDRSELVTFKDLDHQLDDSEVREQMLRKIDAFLRETLGL